MDYTLAALKLFCCQLKDARPTTSSPSAMTLYGILFQRAWLQVPPSLPHLSLSLSRLLNYGRTQGVLVSDWEEGRFVLDDGSDVIELSMFSESRPQEWKRGEFLAFIPYLHFLLSIVPSNKVPDF